MDKESQECKEAFGRILASKSNKKLIVAGPGTGKTTLFEELLKNTEGDNNNRLILTFINNLKNEIEDKLSSYAKVSTLHGYCQGYLHTHQDQTRKLTTKYKCLPGLATLIKKDWLIINKSDPPQFIGEMRNLQEQGSIEFYLTRGDYYDAVDFDDSVYRAYKILSLSPEKLNKYKLVLIDEYQDFNKLEDSFIGLMAKQSPIVIAGDDDQALYSQLRGASWEYIRKLHGNGEYEVFELPFCMRCPQVVVDAVNDIIERAIAVKKLIGRISKPYKHFTPVKGTDSKTYPKISLVDTSVQRTNANYMGKYILKAIKEIPQNEIQQANESKYPVALVIASDPYRTQIYEYLKTTDCHIDVKSETNIPLDRNHGLEILKGEPTSNLGWRIIIEVEKKSFLKKIIKLTVDMKSNIYEILPKDYRDKILEEVAAFEPQKKSDDCSNGEVIKGLTLKITSFEGAKGLSAQHVFICGLHEGEIPRDKENIQDIEICKFVVGLTRTRKKCYMIYTWRFADETRKPTEFINWIKPERYDVIKVNANYFK